MKICYVNKRFRTATKLMIQRANDIVDEAKSAGVDLTLRQMYYEFVARNWLPNRQAAYATLGDVMTDARLAGLVDWDAIEDRTRSLKRAAHWESPTDIIKACSEQYRIDRWKDQERRIEVWVEKDTMAGVLQRSCMDLDVPFFACRGYTSATEMWGASQRLLDYIQGGQEVTIIHLGDHDPSGIDMTRDIKDRLKIFLKDNNEYIKVDRIALNMDQVGKYVDKQAMEGSVAEELRCRGEISLVAGQWKGVVTKATSLQKAADKKAETKRKRDEAKAKMKRK
jgi:hypothetical protein